MLVNIRKLWEFCPFEIRFNVIKTLGYVVNIAPFSDNIKKRVNISVENYLYQAKFNTKKYIKEYGAWAAEFNPLWYVSQNEELKLSKADPIEHYLKNEFLESANPNPYLPAELYRAKFQYFDNKVSVAEHKFNNHQDFKYDVLKYNREKQFPKNYYINQVIEINNINNNDYCVCIYINDVAAFEILSHYLSFKNILCDIYIICPNEALGEQIKSIIGSENNIKIQIDNLINCNNFIVKSCELSENYKYCLNLNLAGYDIVSKNSFIDIFEKILGNKSINIAAILGKFNSDNGLGVLYPLPYSGEFSLPHWGAKLGFAASALNKMKISPNILGKSAFNYPLNSCFWYRNDALKNLKNLANNNLDNNEIEQINKLILYISEDNGYKNSVALNQSNFHNSTYKYKSSANVVLCSYCDEERIKYSELSFLRELSKIFSQVHFVTNERNISNLDELPANINVFTTPNLGYDFGMYKRCIDKYNLSGDTYLINDSIFCVSSIENLIKNMDTSGGDLVGITSSLDVSFHVQSFFMRLSAEALEQFKVYYNKKGVAKGREDAIRTYEVGFSRYLKKKGYKLQSIFELKPTNPSVFYAKEILEADIPIIKKKVVLNSWGADEALTLIKCGYSFYQNWHYIIEAKYATNVIELAIR